MELKRGYDLPKAMRIPGSIPIISSSGPSGWHNESKAIGPGVVTGRYGTVGQVFFVEGEYWPLNTALYVRDFKGSNPRFISYFLKTIPWSKFTDKAAVPGVNRNHVHMEPVVVPPLEEQRRIAGVLGALDDKIELNRKMNRTLEEMAQAIFKSWFIDLDMPNECRVQELIDRGWLVIGDGYRAKRSELAPHGLPFARAANINDGFHFDGPELLGQDGIQRAKHKASQPLDVVFTSKGTVGRFAFVMSSTRPFVYSPQLCFWRSANPQRLSPYFLLYWMRSPAFLGQVAAVKGQTDMADYVSLRDQRRMVIAVPAPQRQAEAVDRIRPLVERQYHATAESRTLTALRDALLPKLISGEIRVPEAEKAVETAL